jgi:hypothetical protein
VPRFPPGHPTSIRIRIGWPMSVARAPALGGITCLAFLCAPMLRLLIVQGLCPPQYVSAPWATWRSKANAT